MIRFLSAALVLAGSALPAFSQASCPASSVIASELDAAYAARNSVSVQQQLGNEPGAQLTRMRAQVILLLARATTPEALELADINIKAFTFGCHPDNCSTSIAATSEERTFIRDHAQKTIDAHLAGRPLPATPPGFRDLATPERIDWAQGVLNCKESESATVPAAPRPSAPAQVYAGPYSDPMDNLWYFAEQYSNGASVEAEIAATISQLGPVQKFEAVSPGGPMNAFTTRRQKAFALAGYMAYWEEKRNFTYGLGNVDPNYIDFILPDVPQPYRGKAATRLNGLKQTWYERQKRYAQQDAINRMLQNFGTAAREYSAPSSAGSSGSNPTFSYQQDAWLFGKANRPPCSASDPCGPGNEFKAFPD